MKLTRTIVLGIAFLMPSVASTLARAEDKPAAAGEEKPAAEGEKKAKKGKKAKKEEAKKEEAPAAGAPTPAPAEKK
jgi:hypothetical protein